MDEKTMESKDSKLSECEDDTRIEIGQFGYLKSILPDCERAFIQIDGKLELESNDFPIKYKYAYTHYDITSSTPQILNGTGGWILPSEFQNINGLLPQSYTSPDDTSSASSLSRSVPPSGETNGFPVLLFYNWKICREHYLLHKVTEFNVHIDTKNNDNNELKDKESSAEDSNETSYLPQSISDSNER